MTNTSPQFNNETFTLEPDKYFLTPLNLQESENDFYRIKKTYHNPGKKNIHSYQFTYKKPVPFHSLIRKADNFGLMTDCLDEQFDHIPCYLNSHGHVCIAGLGLGYCASKIAGKPEVKRITIIEKDKNIIDLIYPQIKKAKIEIINQNFFQFLDEKNSWDFDYTWIDIWYHVSKGIYETNIKPIRNKINALNPKAKMGFWKEDEFAAKFETPTS